MIYKDITDRNEDERIRQIGEKVIQEKLTVGFLTDADPGKADRYIKKLKERFPGIRVIATGKAEVKQFAVVAPQLAQILADRYTSGDGPVDNVIWVMVGPPLN